MKTWIAGLFVMAMLTGCATAPSPREFNGSYYMMGDSNCVLAYPLSPTRIMCGDKHKNQTGYREALSLEQLQMYQLQQAAARQERAELNESLRQTSQMLQQASQPLPSYSSPQVQGIPTQGTTTYNQVGDTLIGTNGTSCQTVGQTTICR